MQRIVGTLAVLLALAACGTPTGNATSERPEVSLTAAEEPSGVSARLNRKGNVTGHWLGNYAGGRKHAPAGH